MSKMSLTDKIGVLIETSKTFNFAILVIIILLFLGFTFISSNKKNKKRTKNIYLVSSVFIVVAFITTYHASLSNLFDYMMNNFFIAVYFPNLAIYAFALLISNIILLISIFNYKISKVIKCINVVVYLLMNYLLSLILNVINTNQLDIFTQKSVYGNTKATALIELSSLLFIIWVIFLIVYRLILIYLKKEYVPPVKRIIRVRKIKKLPANYIPKEVPVYAYGKANLNKKQEELKNDLLKEYEQLFTIEDYKLLSQILREQKKKELEAAKARDTNNNLGLKNNKSLEQQIIQADPIITESYPKETTVNKNEDPELINTILNEMSINETRAKPEELNTNKEETIVGEYTNSNSIQEQAEKEREKLEQEKIIKEQEARLRKEQEEKIRREQEEKLRIEQEKEQRKFTELEELYRSMG